MRMPLEVTFADNTTHTTIAEYPDLCAFEEKFSRSILKLGSEVRLSDLGFLAWHSSKRKGAHALDLADWTLTVSAVRSIDEDTELVPLEQ